MVASKAEKKTFWRRTKKNEYLKKSKGGPFYRSFLPKNTPTPLLSTNQTILRLFLGFLQKVIFCSKFFSKKVFFSKGDPSIETIFLVKNPPKPTFEHESHHFKTSWDFRKKVTPNRRPYLHSRFKLFEIEWMKVFSLFNMQYISYNSYTSSGFVNYCRIWIFTTFFSPDN